MSAIVPRPDIDVASTVEHVEEFITHQLAYAIVQEVEGAERFRAFSNASTEATSSVKAWKAGANPPVAWWGLEWMFLDGENHLARTPDADRLPPMLSALLGLVEARWGFQPNQIQVNRYGDGEGLVWHSDVDSLGWLTDKTVTVSLGAPRDVVYARFPEDWKARKIVGLRPGEGLDADYTVRCDDRSATMLTVEGQRSVAHAVVPGPGLRYGITFRQYRMW